uniref:NACHT domain-containing protein n=1 Tax=Strigamia maritima TaxID=126957 RepID=T1IR54_STRMM
MSCLEYDPERKTSEGNVAQGPVYNLYNIPECGVFYAGSVPSNSISNEQSPPEITIQDSCDLEKNLKKFYKKLTLPRIAWLDLEDAQDLNIDEFFIDLKLDESDKTIRKEDIFNPVDQLQPTRILLEGQPGSGKTSLVTRIAYDWANEKEYLDQFKLLFLLPLRELQEQSVDDALETIGKICGFRDTNKIAGIIASDEQHVLFLFDGLDELSVDDRAHILQLLYQQKYNEVTMLVTCRTGLFSLTKDEDKQLFIGISRQSTFYNKKISVMGIKDADKKMEFLEKFIFVDESVEREVADLKSTVTATELFDCPLFLILLAFIVNTEEKMVTFFTKTDLYKELFNCIIKHSCAKNQIKLDEWFDIFDSKSLPNYLREYLREFGKLSLQHIDENNLRFKSDELTDEMYKLGFLSHHKQVIRFRSNQYYEAFHLSILEFSAAYYVWMEYKFNKSEFKDKLLKFVVQLYLRTRGTSLVLGFMIGLFEEHSCDIFDGMQPFSAWFSKNFHFIAQLLKECSSLIYEKVFPHLTHFIPSHLDLRSSFVHDLLRRESTTKLIGYGSKSGRIKTIYTEDIIDIRILKQIHFSCVKAFFSSIEDLHEILALTSGQVDELDLDIILIHNSKYKTDYLEELLSTIATFKSTTCTVNLYWHERFVKDYRVLFDEAAFAKPLFQYLEIIINPRSINTILFALILLQSDQVRCLSISLNSDNNDLSDLLNAIAKSSNLRSFKFSCNSSVDLLVTTIDLSDLTNGGTKKYDYLELNDCIIVNCKQPLKNKNCIHTLSVNNGISKEILSEIEPTQLQCSISDVHELVEMTPPWPGANSIKSIVINEPNECEHINIDERVLNFLSSCKNLRKLQIVSKMCINDQILVEGLKQLGIEKFVCVVDDLNEPNLFSTLINNWATEYSGDATLQNNFKLQSIDIIFQLFLEELTEVENYVPPGMLALLKGLQRYHWKRVNFVCYDKDDLIFNLFSRQNIIDVSIFNIVHYVYGSDDEDYCDKPDAFGFTDAYAITMK